MNIGLDWQVANDDGRWEPIVQAAARKRLRLPGWVWRVAAAVVVLLVVGQAIAVRYRYRRALQRITVQIQGAIDLEARALAQGDVARYLALQDVSQPGWVERQAARLDWECPEVAATPGLCPFATPVQVARVEMREDVAWVEVAQTQASLRRVRFYRQTPQGWLHTAPHARFWQHPVKVVRGRLFVRAHQRDLPHIELQVAYIVGVVEDVCAILDCPVDVSLEVRFTHHDGPPSLSGSVLTLASPWLVGIPVDEEDLRSLTYWAAYGIASQVAHNDECWWPNPPVPPDVSGEGLHLWTALYSRSDRYDKDVVSEMLGAMRDTCPAGNHNKRDLRSIPKKVCTRPELPGWRPLPSSPRPARSVR